MLCFFCLFFCFPKLNALGKFSFNFCSLHTFNVVWWCVHLAAAGHMYSAVFISLQVCKNRTLYMPVHDIMTCWWIKSNTAGCCILIACTEYEKWQPSENVMAWYRVKTCVLKSFVLECRDATILLNLCFCAFYILVCMFIGTLVCVGVTTVPKLFSQLSWLHCFEKCKCFAEEVFVAS